MKFKTARLIQDIKNKTTYEFVEDGDIIGPQPLQLLMKREEFERALIMAYDAGIQAGKKNPNEVV